MKKLFTAIAALAICSTAAFAQDEENLFMSFEPANYAELTELSQTVTITPDEMILMATPDATGVLVQPISGYGFGQDIKEPLVLPLNDGKASFSLTDSDWGLPFNEVYHIQLIVVLADAAGNPIESEMLEDYVMGMCTYTCPDNQPAAWAKNYPSERNFTEEGLTFARFYETGVCTFFFTKEVKLSDPIGYIVYTDKAGDAEKPDIENYTDGWDEEMGLYAVTVNVKNDDYTTADLQSIEVILEGVTDANDNEVTVPSINVVNSTRQASPRKNKAIEQGLVSGNELVNIYNVQGILVKENVSATAVNELPAGLYIVNGKKVVIR